MGMLAIDNHFWELFPDASIHVLVVKGINNQASQAMTEKTQALLEHATKEAQRFLVQDNFSSNDVVQEWREAFTKFKKKKGARSSIEALLKRVSQGQTFQPINPLVDIYNSVSLEYGVPCGGEDLDKIIGTMTLGIAKGGESFQPVGGTKDEPALAEEVIYYDQEGAICRCFNWRDAQRTMLTEETTNAILVIEAIGEEQQKRGLAAINELKARIAELLGVDGTIEIMTKPS